MLEDPLAEENEGLMQAEGEERAGLLDSHIQEIEDEKEKEKERLHGREERRDKRKQRKRLFAVIFVTFVEIFATTSVDPFIIFMVERFNIAKTEDSVSTYAGLLSTSFLLGQFAGSFLWGTLSDKIGKRPVLFIGLGSGIVLSTAFALSPNYWWAFCIRLVFGFLNGNMGVAKSYITAITTKETVVAAFSHMQTMCSIAIMIGGLCGGYLSYPSIILPFHFSVLDRYPYILPCVAVSLFYILSTILCYFWMPEVVIKKQEESKPLVSINKDAEVAASFISERPEKVSLRKVIFKKVVFISFFANMCINFAAKASYFAFLLWAILPYSQGGINFSTGNLGLVNFITGMLAIVFQHFIYRRLVKMFSTLPLMRVTLFVGAIIFSVTPTAYLVHHFGIIAIWGILVAQFIVRVIATSSAITCASILVNKSERPKYMGAINGLNESLAALVRGLSVLTIGILFSWSEGNHMEFPFNEYFVFLLSGSVSFCAFISSLLVKSDEYY
eukprot:Phypoly_transcript_07821.p1 GENE.Phypoly_transcript_07821~~Phypoly_transcript_07821.p1  ORF type:complete len:500 (+),score=62.11 Phypoly_transcript_07821:64-1563(+)